MDDLIENESWELFSYHTFSFNNGNLPSNKEEEKANLACNRCAWLPLTIQVVGSAHPKHWEWFL